MTTLLCTSLAHEGPYQVAIARSRFNSGCIATVYDYNAGTGVAGEEKAKVLGDKILNPEGQGINTLSEDAQDALITNIKEGRRSICCIMDDAGKRITGIQILSL